MPSRSRGTEPGGPPQPGVAPGTENIDPELRLLLACAAPADEPLPSLGGLDWERLRELAERHRMVPLLGRRLVGREQIPAGAEAWLRDAVRSGGARAMGMAAELSGVLGALDAASVPCAVYKGPALAVRAYGDATLRWCSDLDLLVHPESVPRATAVLAAAGYAAQHALTPARERTFRRFDGDYPLRHPVRGTLIELHCHVSPPRFPFRFDTAALLERRIQVQAGPFRLPALADDDLLPALAVHGAKHRWARMEWLAAFAALSARMGGSPSQLAEAAGPLGAARAVRTAFLLCDALLNVPIEESLRSDPTAVALADEAAARMLGDDPRHDARDTAGNLRFNLRLCDTVGDRVRAAWRWTTRPSPEDWAARPLPDALFPLYRVIRPIRLLGRYGPLGSP